MAVDVHLVIADSEAGSVVEEGWLGMSGARDLTLAVLNRPPHYETAGFKSWGGVTPAEALRISAANYSNSDVTREIVERWKAQYPPPRFWWSITFDF